MTPHRLVPPLLYKPQSVTSLLPDRGFPYGGGKLAASFAILENGVHYSGRLIAQLKSTKNLSSHPDHKKAFSEIMYNLGESSGMRLWSSLAFLLNGHCP